jgi:NAD(P)-dependent dehydrogenase (short-subunit alcohol dehydrogenase family)
MPSRTDHPVDKNEVGSLQESVEEPQEDQALIDQRQTYENPLAKYRDLIAFAIGLILPYIFHPLLGIEVYHPGLASMWPFAATSPFTPATGIKSLAGKVILVTGGNNGIGKETILQLAKHNPHKIFLAARTESKARDAIASIKSQDLQDVDIEYLPLDLSSLPSVKSAADQVIRKSDRLDILILNAGIMAVPPGKTPSGQDIQLGTNHVGHFLLTKLLLPTLERTAKQHNSDVRVLAVASEAHNMAPNLATILSTEKLTKTSPWTRYGASKAANIMFTAELARRYPTLTSVSLHPGMIKTDLYLPNSESNFLVRYGAIIFGPLIFQTVANGAFNQLWASAGAEKSELVSGSYYTPVGKLRHNKWASDADAGRKLWEWTEKELATAGY